ncbi:rev protein [Human immunodeficiency virus 2]|uniref:Protein Rev n=1 Tax=Human immunodeficiency virus 2 TaxID=11709 RepID=A0A0K2GUS8_9HIV2|nr:rev protein [Human immunodeficiency virus 2]
MSDLEEEELRRRIRFIHFLHQTNPYPTGPGTARRRRQRRRRWRKRWQQILALADRVHSFPDPPVDSPLDLAVQQLQRLNIQELPDPPPADPVDPQENQCSSNSN